MPTSQGDAFRLITVNDDEEELVVHAGSGRMAAPVRTDAASAAVDDTMPEAAAAEQEAPALSARQEELLRRAAELEQAEAGLKDPHAFSRMRIYVLVALVIIVLVVVFYTVGFPF